MYTCLCTCTCVETRGEWRVFFIAPYLHFFCFFWRQGLSLTNSVILAGQWFPESFLSSFPPYCDTSYLACFLHACWGDSHSGPYACPTTTSLTGSSSQLYLYMLWREGITIWLRPPSNVWFPCLIFSSAGTNVQLFTGTWHDLTKLFLSFFWQLISFI